MKRERNNKVFSFTNFVYCMEKRLGINGVEVTEEIYKHLDKKHPHATYARNIPIDDAVELKKHFLAQVSGDLNDIQIASFEKNFEEAVKQGGDDFSDYRINPNYDTGCKTVVMTGARRRRTSIISYNK